MVIIKKIMRAIAVIFALPMMIAEPLRAYASDTVLDNPEWNAFVEEKIELDNPPGLAAAIVNGAETGYKNWGYANIEEQSPVTEDTVFGIGSCSKAFTALSVFLLQEDGKLSVEDSVSDYLPWWNATWNGQPQDTKIWQLLEHCSGISNTTMMQYPESGGAPNNEDIAHIAENIELVYEPGTKFEYCNLGYDILVYITETVSGQPFEEYVTNDRLLVSVHVPDSVCGTECDDPLDDNFKRYPIHCRQAHLKSIFTKTEQPSLSCSVSFMSEPQLV